MGILTGLSATAISQLSATRIKALSPADIAGMTAAQLPGLTAAQTALLSAGQLMSFTKAQIPYLTPSAITGLAPKQIALLLPPQVGAFTPDQIAALSTAQVGALNPADILALSPTQVKAFTTAQVAALTLPQFSVLSAADIAALSPQQIASINDTDIAIINQAQLKALSAAQAAALTPDQLSHLNPTQLKTLSGLLTTPTPTPPAPTPPAPTPPVITPPAPTPPAPTPPTPTPPAPTPPAPTPPAPTPPADPTPPAPTTTIPDPTPPAPTTPVTTPPAPTPPAPTPANDPPSLTPSQLAAMTGAQLAALTADQIKALGADQLGALNLDYNKMLALLQVDAKGGMNAGEFAALQAWAGKLNVTGGISVTPYLQQITDNVILGNPANSNWTGGGNVAVPLGNLTAASNEVQVNELIGKWFLGTDLPVAKVKIDGAPNFSVTHKAATTPLYANGVSMSDINQGNLGDCFFLAGLAEVAAQNPSAIQSMITDNGNSTYGVCFTINGKADYVTVDNDLAGGGNIFNHGADDWGGLIEKAYAQLQAGGNVTGNPSGFGNSYTNLANGGSPESALEAITGAATIIDYVADGTTWKSYTFDGPSLTVPDNAKASKVVSSASNMSMADLQAQLSADIAAGAYVVLSSNKDARDANGKATLMADHAMAVYGYDSGTGQFEIYNPWGTATSGAQPWDTTFEIGLDKLLADGDIISVASNSPAGNLVSASPGLARPSASPFASAPSVLGLASIG